MKANKQCICMQRACAIPSISVCVVYTDFPNIPGNFRTALFRVSINLGEQCTKMYTVNRKKITFNFF